MKKRLVLILMIVALLLTISSCTLVRKGELRLLDMEIRDSARLRTNAQFGFVSILKQTVSRRFAGLVSVG